MTIKKSLILQLYKDLFKYGQQLKYTDKNFYLNYIRNQFNIAGSQDYKQIEILFKGETLLKNKRVI
jgi:hypothetical protein